MFSGINPYGMHNEGANLFESRQISQKKDTHFSGFLEEYCTKIDDRSRHIPFDMKGAPKTFVSRDLKCLKR